MTLEQLNEVYSKYTGLRIDIASLIENADEDKQKVYEHLMWHLRKGRIIERPADQEILEELVPAIQEALNIEPEEKSSEIDIEATYTAAEAADYNLTLEGALQYGAIKTPAVPAVEAKPAIYSFASFGVDDNAAYGTGTVKVISQDENATTIEVLTNEPAGNTTQEAAEQFVGKQYIVKDTKLEVDKHYNLYSDTGLQTPIYVTVELVSEAVEAVAAQEAVLYTNEEVDAHNAQLPGAKKEGDKK